MSLLQTLTEFRNSVQENNLNFTSAYQVNIAGDYIFDKNIRVLITEASFLKIFISWERFLEQSFTKYLTGKKSITNNRLSSCIKRIDMNRASEIVKGTNKYIDWSNPDIILRLSKLYFGITNPYTDNLNPIKIDLFDLRTIRNAAAHLSTTTSKSFDSLASRILKENKSSVNVADFVLTMIPDTTDTVIDYYINVLDITAENIANA
ncbi:MAG: hypothetical protein KJ804_12270 [Proteobacteria bacterium]|nr:hypothetical protein [Pseudomonadota bacterium]